MPLELNAIRLDAKKCRDGVWWSLEANHDYQPGGLRLKGRPLIGEPADDQAAILIRNRDYLFDSIVEDERQRMPIEMRTKPEARRLVTGRAIAKALWRGAKNLSIGGKTFAWSDFEAERVACSEEWTDLVDFILWASMDRAALAADEERKASGN